MTEYPRTRRRPLPRPLTAQQAQQALRHALATGLTRLTTHVRERMVDPERAFDMEDVKRLSTQGAVRTAPEFDVKYRSWEYRIEGDDVDGRPLEVVFAVGEGGVVTLVTGRRP